MRAAALILLLACCAKEPSPTYWGTVREVEEDKAVTLNGWITHYKWVCRFDDGSIETGISTKIIRVGWKLGFREGRLVEIREGP